MTTITTPTGHTGGLVQLKIPRQWAAIGRRRPPASAAGGRRPQNLKKYIKNNQKHDPFKGAKKTRKAIGHPLGNTF